MRKLVLEDVVEEAYRLIAIHSTIEEYKLAFLLNKHLGLQLTRSRKDIDLNTGERKARFARYTYIDPSQYCSFHLISNVAKEYYKMSGDVDSLFGHTDSTSHTSYLLPEFRKTEYLLKVEDELSEGFIEILIKKIMGIPEVSIAYELEHQQIKSKENLIID